MHLILQVALCDPFTQPTNVKSGSLQQCSSMEHVSSSRRHLSDMAVDHE